MRKKKGILITAVLACTVALGAGGYVLAAQTGKKEAVQETKRVQTILPVLKVTEDREMENPRGNREKTEGQCGDNRYRSGA